MRKILCVECDRWLARVEDGYVWIKCPRCRGYHKEAIGNFIADLEEMADDLRESAKKAGIEVPIKRKAFG